MEQSSRDWAQSQGQPTYPTAVVERRITKEADPNGKSPHEAGAKVDAGKVEMTLITGGMARALYEVAKIGTFGANKYSRDGWISVPDGFRRYEDAQQRHASSRHRGETLDADSKELHLAHEAWNALAKLDLFLREQERIAATRAAGQQAK